MEKTLASLSKIDRLELANYGLGNNSAKKILSSYQILDEVNSDTCLFNLSGIRITKESEHARLCVDYHQPILIKKEISKKSGEEVVLSLYPFGVGFDKRRELDYEKLFGENASGLENSCGIAFYHNDERIKLELLGNLEGLLLEVLPNNQIQKNLFVAIQKEYGLILEETPKKERYSIKQEFSINSTRFLTKRNICPLRTINLNIALENRKEGDFEEKDDSSLKDICISLRSSKRDISSKIKEYASGHTNRKQMEIPLHDGRSITIFPSTSQIVHLDNIMGILYGRN